MARRLRPTKRGRWQPVCCPAAMQCLVVPAVEALWAELQASQCVLPLAELHLSLRGGDDVHPPAGIRRDGQPALRGAAVAAVAHPATCGAGVVGGSDSAQGQAHGRTVFRQRAKESASSTSRSTSIGGGAHYLPPVHHAHAARRRALHLDATLQSRPPKSSGRSSQAMTSQGSCSGAVAAIIIIVILATSKCRKVHPRGHRRAHANAQCAGLTTRARRQHPVRRRPVGP